MRFCVENFGCRATQADGTLLAQQLRARGHEPVETPERAHLLILNTCTVTAAADQQARERVRQLHQKFPTCTIVVTGCYAQRAPEELGALAGVRAVVGNSHKFDIPRLLDQELAPGSFVPLISRAPAPGLPAPGDGLASAERPAKIVNGDVRAETLLPTPAFADSAADRTRPILKIQDGCNHRCAYCVIPFVRGRSRSLPADAVVDAIRHWVATGVKEVVLSGIDLGSYGRDLPQNGTGKPRPTLRTLTECILTETALPLLRFSSIEPADLTPAFLCLWASSDRIARHLHAPLQSGSNRILRRMCRPYRAEEYAARVLAAAEQLPNLGLGADVIVGFPGETEADFAATCKLVEELPFSYLHVFSFSKRPGTRAWEMTDNVSPTTIQARARHLRALAAEKQCQFRQAQIGQRLKVLTLQRGHADGRREALSENYLKVLLPASFLPNQFLLAEVTAVEGEHLLAVPVAPDWRLGGTRPDAIDATAESD